MSSPGSSFPGVSEDSGERPLPWWATVPLEVLFPPPKPPPARVDKPVRRRRESIRRRPGPGRPSVMTDDMIEDAKHMHKSGECSAAEIAQELGVSRATIFRYLKSG